MAALTLSPNDIKVLDQARQRLSQLTKTLQSLQGQILSNDPLPAWSELTQLSSVISQNLAALSSLLSENEPLLSALAVYPLPAFPGRTQEGLLEQLLRKKLEPDIEDWAAAGQKLAESRAAGGGSSSNDADGPAALAAARSLWEWAPAAANAQARRHMFIGNDYTRAEVEAGVERVVTGLRRELVVPAEGDSSDEDDDDDDDDDDEVAVEPGEPGDDGGLGMVGVRRGSEATGGVEFEVRTKEAAGGAAEAVPVAAQLRFMVTGSMSR